MDLSVSTSVNSQDRVSPGEPFTNFRHLPSLAFGF